MARSLFLYLFLIMFLIMPKIADSSNKWPYKLYRGNFHIHSSFSNEARTSGSYALARKMGLGDADHVISLDPNKTCLLANNLGLNIVGFSDHGEYLNGSNWEELSKISKSRSSQSFVALRGFEWTKEGMIDSDNLPVAHVNVWGSRNFTATKSKFTGYGVAGTNQNYKVNPDFKSFCDWVIKEGELDPYLVIQLNHITYGNFHFDNLNFAKNREILKDYFALMEVGSGPFPIYVPIAKGEKYYQLALMSGLFVAPTVGYDNYGAIDENARKRHTAVWIDESISGSPQEKILSALLQRKTFASEDKEFVLQYWAKLEGDEQTYYLGDRMNFMRGKQVTFSIELIDDEPIGQVEIVEIKKNGASHSDFDSKNPTISGKYYSGSKVVFPSENALAFYIKILQKDGDVIISSPIGTEISVPEVRKQYRPDPKKVDVMEALRGFFNFEVIICKGIKKTNFGFEPVDETDVFYSGRDKIITLVKFANLDRNYSYPCVIKTILFHPSGKITVDKHTVNEKNEEEGLFKMGKVELDSGGTYTIEGYVNGDLYVRKKFKLIK